MTGRVSTNRRKRRKSSSKSNPRKRQSVQKPNGVIGPRVAKVGGEKFTIVCIDPAKHRSEWMMADYFGNLLIKRHRRPEVKANCGLRCYRWQSLMLSRRKVRRPTFDQVFINAATARRLHGPRCGIGCT